jgi:hypothetical protein
VPWSVVSIALLVALLTLAPAQAAGDSNAPVLEIVASPELRAAAAQIEGFDRSKLSSVMRLVGLDQPGMPITVLLAAEDSDLARQTPPWVAGFAHADSSTIVLFPARTPSYPHDSMEAVLHHEVAHVLIGRAAGRGVVPRWFHEGLALAAERGSRFTDHTRLAIAVVSSERSLLAVDADFGGGARAAARAYAVSGAFVRDLLGRYDAQVPARLLARLSLGDSFDLAFVSATGTTLSEAERVFWRDSWWYQVVPFATSSFAIWTGVTFLAFLARQRRRRRRAALHRFWEEEEERQRATDDVTSSS